MAPIPGPGTSSPGPATVALLALDLVGVAGRATTDRRLERMAAASGLTADEVHERIWASGFDTECDAGLHTLEDARATVRRLLGVDASVDELRAWWAAGLLPDPGVLALTDRARARGLPTALLTNNGPLLLDALEHHELDAVWRRFDRHCFCFRYRVRKPELAAYEAFAADVGVEPGLIAFVDDSPANVDGARDAGLHAHLYQGDVPGLEAFLAGLGVV
ncbi:HAD-IA family hydrolase [Patulibacter sp. NPDC049589]|uniref:HAD-IA family hydrolase n=1 Tax=Patulibacter sp. NPDC049589 TaxID=3154731 RepID=UPI0034227E65